MGGLTVENEFIRVDPQPRKFGQHVDHFVSFQVVNKNVWQPEIFDKFQVHRTHEWAGLVILGLKCIRLKTYYYISNIFDLIQTSSSGSTKSLCSVHSTLK